MKYIIKEMSRDCAIEISNWTYEEPYNIYNGVRSEEFIQELLDGNYFSVIEENDEIVGFYCFGSAAQVPIGKQYQAYDDMSFVDIGLGMRPDLCGKGEGYDFFIKGLEFAQNKFLAKKFRLTVALFNKRAIKLYKRIGFNKIITFERKNADSAMSFLVMVMT
ncbi:GNAT family N-acetyltransferase [Alkaliphilus hydrothermalis]|uniref:RimJ/RimL family protein N-acetyltransferase n=1 Tax=Alkaliphilus hydrothermalis TaxID=1482730 RepID=A0ABS2NTY4_9FIRM|nr:GNAT family protein [Alkaliphilus hydrothermalis]MBM7616415.1 RimJ/RimL family protein N-acetyltransferase [Alkaliphilus hydrothermalis]